MADSVGACFVVVDGSACTRKSMKAIEYNLEKLPEILKVPIAFAIPMCGYHVGVVYDNGADFMRAMDQIVSNGIPLTDEEAEEINAEITNEIQLSDATTQPDERSASVTELGAEVESSGSENN